MSWAAKRTTTRVEDKAYCLLGIFDVAMPLIYGEGPKAFRRLQEEIMKTTQDLTIMGWTPPAPSGQQGGKHPVFASSPSDFTTYSSEIVGARTALKALEIDTFAPDLAATNQGLRTRVQLWSYVDPGIRTRVHALWIGYFAYSRGPTRGADMAFLPLEMVAPSAFVRRGTRLVSITPCMSGLALAREERSVLICDDSAPFSSIRFPTTTPFVSDSAPEMALAITGAMPHSHWDDTSNRMFIPRCINDILVVFWSGQVGGRQRLSFLVAVDSSPLVERGTARIYLLSHRMYPRLVDFLGDSNHTPRRWSELESKFADELLSLADRPNILSEAGYDIKGTIKRVPSPDGGFSLSHAVEFAVDRWPANRPSKPLSLQQTGEKAAAT